MRLIDIELKSNIIILQLKKLFDVLSILFTNVFILLFLIFPFFLVSTF